MTSTDAATTFVSCREEGPVRRPTHLKVFKESGRGIVEGNLREVSSLLKQSETRDTDGEDEGLGTGLCCERGLERSTQ